MTNSTSDNFFTFLIYLPIFSIFSVGLFYFGWDKAVISLFLISIISCIFKYKTHAIRENIKDPYIVILILSTLYGSVLYKTIGYGSGEIRTLIACCLFFLFFPKDKITVSSFPALIVIASIASFLFVIYSKYFLNIDRATWPFNPITYSMSLCLFASYSLYYGLKTKRYIYIFSYFLFTISIFLTESRGPILSLLITSLLLIAMTTLTQKNIRKTFLLIITFILAITTFTHKPLIERIESTRNEITTLSTGNYKTSIGLRLQMWMSAPYIIAEKPFFGVGNKFKNELNKISKRDSFFKTIASFSPSHFHNQYIDKAVRSGIIGLILCLLTIYFPLYQCWKKRNFISKESRIIITSLAMSVTICSLTEVPMNQSFFLFPFLILNYFQLRAPIEVGK
ncbi:O-antigen ligase family protein [Vibrio lentus]|uniref:O-antigen ligase family protein n=1 Tax=Vibrio lentus TaxID=136468 RepID=UPI00178CFBA5|nr:O-antigen ligase family protein [Vibrio lentus]MDN3632417.1 O-antigen ligase family protein [Vibrio lentus]